ncbi:MAG: sodium:calcium antiporter [Chloroflexi bacterium]|nr:sodium:calcium antiporter [Chloroflexota bacterium]
MVWIQFLITSAIVVWAAIKLAEYGDVIAVRTKLGGLFVGTIFLAGATSLPEMIASISSFRLGQPDLAAGNFFGSNMVNMVLLAIVDLVNYQVPLLRRVAVSHALTAALTTILMLVAVIFMLANISVMIGWVGIESILLILLYFGGIWMIQRENRGAAVVATAVAPEPAPGFPSLRRGALGFAAAAVVLMAAVPLLVSSTAAIAVLTGLSGGFVGTALLSVVTSLPELLAALAAVRIGAFDMAVGNLIGSSVFNMLALGFADFFYVNGRFLGDIDDSFVLVAVLGILLTNMALVGNLARVERKFLFIELDAVAIIVVYLLAMYLLFLNGIGI